MAEKLKDVLGDGKIRREVLISHWNVNGIRAIAKKGSFLKYFAEHQVDIMCINESKVDEASFYQERVSLLVPPEYHQYWNFCKEKKGYSGVAIFTKIPPLACTYDIGIEKHDKEGRVITHEYEDFYLVAVYVPNSGDDGKRLKYRTCEWDPDFRDYLNKLRKHKSVLLVGDLNVARENIDVFNPERCSKFSGFLKEERDEFEKFFADGWIDIFRRKRPNEAKFSFYNYFINQGMRKLGLRIDYFLSDQKIFDRVSDVQILDSVVGSDHVPIQLKLQPPHHQLLKPKTEFAPITQQEGHFEDGFLEELMESLERKPKTEPSASARPTRDPKHSEQRGGGASN